MYPKISPIHNFLIIFLQWHWDHFIWNEFCLWLRIGSGFESVQTNPTSCCAYGYVVFTWEVLFQSQLQAYVKKKIICLGKLNAQGPAALSVPGLWKGWLPTANVLERCCGPCNDHQPHFGEPRQPESVWFSGSQAVSWTEPRSALQRVGKIQFYLHCWEALWWLCLNLTQNLCTGAQEI